MFRKCFLVIFLILSFLGVPTFAEELEDNLKAGNNVFLYLYTPECKYCQLFKPNYEKLVKNYDKEFIYIKANTSTLYGQKLLLTYGGRYVPYVAMINGKTKRGIQIAPSCLLNYQCLETAVKSFKDNKI